MPADLPTTPTVPTEADERLAAVWRGPHLAAASRIAEHERCVERLAEWAVEWEEDKELVDLSNPVGWARRILEDRT